MRVMQGNRARKAVWKNLTWVVSDLELDICVYTYEVYIPKCFAKRWQASCSLSLSLFPFSCTLFVSASPGDKSARILPWLCIGG